MTKRLLLKDGLRIGKTELGVMNTAALEYTAEALAALADSLPAVLTTKSTSGALGPELRVDVSGTSGGITVQTGTALYANGVTAALEAAASLTVGINTTNAKVVLTATATTAGLGLFALGSDRLTLTYTPATGKTTSAADLYKVNEYIRLSKGATNYGTFRITSVSPGDRVTTFGTLGLASLVTLASGAVADVVHAPAGKFFEGYPLVGETTATVERFVGVVSVQSSSYTLTSSDVLLATASRGASGAATVTEARTPLVPRLAALQLTNNNIATTAAIDESKLSLTQALLNAKAWAHVQNTDTHTTSSTFRVAGVSGPRVLTEEDIPSLTANNNPPTAAMTGVSLEPATFSLNPGQTTTLVANPQGLASGSSVTYTFASTDITKATVVPNGTSVTVTIPANATAGTVTITVSAVASAVEGYSGVTQTDSTIGTISIIGSGSGNALTDATVDPRPVTMSLKNATGAFNAQLLTATVTKNASAPTGTQISYVWASANPAVCVLDSGGSDDKKSLRAVAAGTTTVTMTASAVNGTTGTYTANALSTISIPVTITETSTASLGEEVNLRVSFNSGAEQATVRWGAVCTTTGTYPNFSVQAGHELAAGEVLTGAAFYDRDGRRYQIASQTAIATAGAAFTITVQKLDAATANALSGSNCYIQSMANTVQVEVKDSTGMQCYVTATAQATARAVGIGRGAAGAAVGSNYRFVHTGANNTLTPTTRQTSTALIRWGETASGLGPVTLYDNWVGPIATSLTSSAMAFAWNLDNMSTAGYNRETMDVFARHKVGSGAYVDWVRTLDKNASGQNLSDGAYRVAGLPANTDVTAEFKLSDPAGLNLVPTLGGIPHPTVVVQRTLGNVGDGAEVEKTWSFAISGASTWFDLSGGFELGNAYALAATNVSSLGSNVTVEFNYPVEVTRIQLVMTTPLGPVTSFVKPILFPLDTFPPSLTGDFSNIVSGDLSASSTDRTINGADINQGAKGIGCAIEYAGTQPISGAGYVRAWFRART